MRKIRHIVVHSTATPPLLKREAIKELVRGESRKRTPQFHYLILRDGEIVQLLNERIPAAAGKGMRRGCLHIAYAGGLNEYGITCDNATQKQKDALFDKIVWLFEKYPDARIAGVQELDKDAVTSPGFQVKEWLANYLPDLSENETVFEPDYDLEHVA